MKKFIVKIVVFFLDLIVVLFGFKITKFPTAKIGALIEAYLQFIYLTRAKKIIFICTEEVSNDYVFQHIKKQIKIFKSSFLTHLYFSKKGKKNYPNHVYYNQFPKKKYTDELILNKRAHIINFNDSDKKKINLILNEINFNNVFQDYNKFVCLNLRTSNFHNDKVTPQEIIMI